MAKVPSGKRRSFVSTWLGGGLSVFLLMPTVHAKPQDDRALSLCESEFSGYVFGKSRLLRGCKLGIEIVNKNLGKPDTLKNSMRECEALEGTNLQSGCIRGMDRRLEQERQVVAPSTEPIVRETQRAVVQ